MSTSLKAFRDHTHYLIYKREIASWLDLIFTKMTGILSSSRIVKFIISKMDAQIDQLY